MYAQITSFHAPMGMMKQLHQLIQAEYLECARAVSGFEAAYFLEEADDPDRTQLVQVWADHSALEDFNRTRVPEQIFRVACELIPGLRIRRAGYIVLLEATKTSDVRTVAAL